MERPQPETRPITKSFTGDVGYTVLGVTEHYFPSRYQNINCKVAECKADIKNFRQMEVELVFSLDINSQTVEELYEGEYWKYDQTRNLLETTKEKGFKTPAPLVALMLNKYLQVIEAELYINKKKEPLAIDNGADLLILPPSYPPLTELPEDEAYVYYDKKSAVFYGNIAPNQEYRLKIKLESNAATFEFATLFPYKEVQYPKIDMTSSSDFEIEPTASLVYPVTSKEFPEWYEYHLSKLLSMEPTRPLFRPAVPERGSMPLFGPIELFRGAGIALPKNKEELMEKLDEAFIDASKPFSVSDYGAVRFAFMVLIPENKNTDIIVRTIQRPLPTRIYEQLQSLPNYREVLVEYDIFNLSNDKKLRLRIETEISGYTDKASKCVFIHPINNKKGKKARHIEYQCPRLKRDVLETIVKPEKATMLCKVKNEDTKEILFEESYNIDLLPHDQMVWELNDVRSSHAYRLYDFICAWISPTDKDGRLDEVRAKTAEYHPDKAFGHNNSTLEGIQGQVRALYDYLADYGIKYVNQPFTAKNMEESQRVVLPETVLKNKAGNCIDLSVLFASILEGAGIPTHILITTDHAFVGWGDKRSLDTMFFLETTMVGRNDFDTAIAKGKEKFIEDFMFQGASVPFALDMIAHMRGNHFVDLQEVRHSGLVTRR